MYYKYYIYYIYYEYYIYYTCCAYNIYYNHNMYFIYYVWHIIFIYIYTHLSYIFYILYTTLNIFISGVSVDLIGRVYIKIFSRACRLYVLKNKIKVKSIIPGSKYFIWQIPGSPANYRILQKSQPPHTGNLFLKRGKKTDPSDKGGEGWVRAQAQSAEQQQWE